MALSLFTKVQTVYLESAVGTLIFDLHYMTNHYYLCIPGTLQVDAILSPGFFASLFSLNTPIQ
jgi:hypothetical protein